jgi:hypothetical protein
VDCSRQISFLAYRALHANPAHHPVFTQQKLRLFIMYLIAIAWMYVVLMMAVAEATNSNGTILGALFTFALYGLLPLGIVLYIFGTPGRKRARLAAEAAAEVATAQEASVSAPNDGHHAPGDAVAPVRKEP